MVPVRRYLEAFGACFTTEEARRLSNDTRRKHHFTPSTVMDSPKIAGGYPAKQHSLPQAATPPHPFYSLPPELILDIVDLLPPESFINFVFANYPLLHANGLAPALSQSRVRYITTQTQIPNLFPLLKMPAEMMLQIISYLKPIDIMRFVVANYQVLERQGIAPLMADVTVRQLRKAVGTGGDRAD